MIRQLLVSDILPPDESSNPQKVYPDISKILATKAEWRREQAALSWEEKIKIVDKMRKEFSRDSWGR